jgi:hypothetical protein
MVMSAKVADPIADDAFLYFPSVVGCSSQYKDIINVAKLSKRPVTIPEYYV